MDDQIEALDQASSTALEFAFRYGPRIGTALVILVLFLFLGDLRSSLIVIATLVLTPGLTFVVMNFYGMSANRDRWWDNRNAAHLGYVPTETSEIFRAQVEAQPPLPADDPAALYQGGAFVKAGPFGD